MWWRLGQVACFAVAFMAGLVVFRAFTYPENPPTAFQEDLLWVIGIFGLGVGLLSIGAERAYNELLERLDKR